MTLAGLRPGGVTQDFLMGQNACRIEGSARWRHDNTMLHSLPEGVVALLLNENAPPSPTKVAALAEIPGTLIVPPAHPAPPLPLVLLDLGHVEEGVACPLLALDARRPLED